MADADRQHWWDIPLTIAIALGVVLLVTTFLVKPFSIPSGSMEDTLGIGDRVLVNRAVYHVRPIERGDIVVFDGSDSFVPASEVPQGMLWVMGDHRSNSADSRFHLGDPGGGFVPESKVVGRAMAVLWPLTRLQVLGIPETFATVPDAPVAVP